MEYARQRCNPYANFKLEPMRYQITASIVAYKNNSDMLRKAIQSFLNTPLQVKLYFVDNSPTDALRSIIDDERIEYIFNNANLGFGKAHNIAMRRALEESSYHLVLNPDIYFDGGVLDEIVQLHGAPSRRRTDDAENSLSR